MFAEGTEEIIHNAIIKETIAAREKYGTTYHSKHEAYAVLKEEVEEARECIESLRPAMHIFWKSVRGKKIDEIKSYSDTRQLTYINKIATQLAHEAIQIAAVCQKSIDSVEEEYD